MNDPPVDTDFLLHQLFGARLLLLYLSRPLGQLTACWGSQFPTSHQLDVSVITLSGHRKHMEAGSGPERDESPSKDLF
ncbi:hypothetical protein CHARACLAT_029165 [Characodon lateralis]|uniref:Uncharacterized protein n=1 Tax=Characodon lateralis TaxID=208331 RepID=A0ABU7DAY2_9TELE|nr:hypothetical protein [Characodon lateralis]